MTSDPLPLAGPREVVVVTQSVNEAVATLGALEQKATALAAGDIGAALAARVPGELAELLDRSVHRLARSIQDRQELQQQLLHDATHDSLTGLLNRRGAIAALSTLLERPEGVVVVMFMDLDGFKQINDSLGHSFGDAVLTTTAERLTHIAPVPAVLARLGGDEFIVAASVAAPADAEAFAASVIRGLAAPVSLSGHHHRVGVSAGVSIARPGDGTRELLRWADVALYRAKQNGRDRFVVVDEGLRRELRLGAASNTSFASPSRPIAWKCTTSSSPTRAPAG